MSNLPTIDTKAIIEDLGLGDKARISGGRDLPSNTETTLDVAEQEIVSLIASFNRKGRKIADDIVSDLFAQFANIHLGGFQRQIKDLPDYIRIQVNKGLQSQKLNLIALRRRERLLLGALNAFEDKHQLEGPAEYPESKLFHWSIVVALVLTESIANSYFFAKGSDFGLVGGALQALLISVVNIGVALFAGNYIFRNLSHISIVRKVMAGVALVVYGFFVLIFNLATAHYRALLEIDPTTALINTLPNLKRSPFGFDNFDAAILLFIGIIFAVAAMIKSYKADSFYPGHGALDRRHKVAEEDYREGREIARKTAHEELDKGLAAADRIEEGARRAAYEQPIILDRLENFSKDYAQYNDSLNEAQKTLLNFYRERNSRVRPSPAPSYFSVYPEVKTDTDLPLDRLTKDREEANRADEFLKEVEEEVVAFSKTYKKLDKEVNDEFDSFIADIEDAALKDSGPEIELQNSD